MALRFLSLSQLRLNIKGSLVLMVCILFTTIFYCLLSNPKPTIHDLMNETHRQFYNLKEVVVPEQSADDSKEEKCEKYLKQLGFTSQPRLFPKDIWPNVSLPVIVSAIESNQVHLAIGFIKSIQLIPDSTVFIYDLGLDDYDLKLINKICNSSSTQTSNISPSSSLSSSSSSSPSSSSINTFTCVIRKFNFDNYPSHVSDLKLFAFRPIIIQEVLDQTGSALWLDANYYFLSSAQNKLLKLKKQAEKEGILSWTIDQPTSTLTHPRMFDYFNEKTINYYFHRMIKPSHILLYNIERIHNNLMLPWVKCALTPECIAPIGAQSSGCRFNKKPLYRYSGCHYYDTSAINVILGIMFNYNEKPYAAQESEKFFKKFTIEEANDIFVDEDVDIDFGNEKLKNTNKFNGDNQDNNDSNYLSIGKYSSGNFLY